MTSALMNTPYVIVGGGIIGMAVAHSLVTLGGIAGSDITVLESAASFEEFNGNSIKGAGLVSQLRHSTGGISLNAKAVEHFKQLSANRGKDKIRPYWRQNGSLRIALTPHGTKELTDLAHHAKLAGIATEFLHPHKAEEMFPTLSLKRHHEANILFCPSDGFIAPNSLLRTYHADVLAAGVNLAYDTRLEDVLLHHHSHRVEGVKTSRGQIDCKYLIDCAGIHSYHVGALCHKALPLIPVRHHSVTTEHLVDLHQMPPALRFSELGIYARFDEGALLVGGFESDATGVDPKTFSINQKPSLWGKVDESVVDEFLEKLKPMLHLPTNHQLKKSRVVSGLPVMTPDGKPIVGEVAGVPGFLVGAGCNAHGVSSAPVIAQALMECMFEDKPSDIVQTLSPNRFTEAVDVPHWPHLVQQAFKTYETFYRMEH